LVRHARSVFRSADTDPIDTVVEKAGRAYAEAIWMTGRSDMLLWIVVGVVAVAVLAFAFWPRGRGVVDGEVRRSRRRSQGEVQTYSNPSGRSFGPY
jgi:hypothetical protein